jgi:hypothetical protein
MQSKYIMPATTNDLNKVNLLNPINDIKRATQVMSVGIIGQNSITHN